MNKTSRLSHRESFLMPWIASVLLVLFVMLAMGLGYLVVPEPTANACEDTATAYDCSIRCCNKPLFHPQRGITADGTNLKGKSRLEMMVVASNVYPLGTVVSLTFPNAPEYDGIYRVADIGCAVIDVFIGDDWNELPLAETCEFGRQVVRIEILREEKS